MDRFDGQGLCPSSHFIQCNPPLQPQSATLFKFFFSLSFQLKITQLGSTFISNPSANISNGIYCTLLCPQHGDSPITHHRCVCGPCMICRGHFKAKLQYPLNISEISLSTYLFLNITLTHLTLENSVIAYPF